MFTCTLISRNVRKAKIQHPRQWLWRTQQHRENQHLGEQPRKLPKARHPSSRSETTSDSITAQLVSDSGKEISRIREDKLCLRHTGKIYCLESTRSCLWILRARFSFTWRPLYTVGIFTFTLKPLYTIRLVYKEVCVNKKLVLIIRRTHISNISPLDLFQLPHTLIYLCTETHPTPTESHIH